MGSVRGSLCSLAGLTGAGATGRVGGRMGGPSAAVSWRCRAIMSVNTVTWLVRADRVAAAAAAEVLISPSLRLPGKMLRTVRNGDL